MNNYIIHIIHSLLGWWSGRMVGKKKWRPVKTSKLYYPCLRTSPLILRGPLCSCIVLRSNVSRSCNAFISAEWRAEMIVVPSILIGLIMLYNRAKKFWILYIEFRLIVFIQSDVSNCIRLTMILLIDRTSRIQAKESLTNLIWCNFRKFHYFTSFHISKFFSLENFSRCIHCNITRAYKAIESFNKIRKLMTFYRHAFLYNRFSNSTERLSEVYDCHSAKEKE